jgi:hypothetical protein
VAAAEKKRLEDELAEEKCKAIEATTQFNTMSIGRSNLRAVNLVEGRSASCVLIVVSCRVSQS